MQKVYLLLRSNRQIGPHSAEELASLNLQATDLIWIEGKSTAWVYPQEIPELLPFLKNGPAGNTVPKQHEAYLPGTKKEPPQEKKERHVFVSLPEKAPAPQPIKETAPAAQSLEEKAEALRQRAQAYTASTPPLEDVLAPHETPLTDTEDSYTTWAAEKQKQKVKKALLYNWMAVAAVLILSAGGFIIAKNVFKPQEEKEEASVNSSRIQEAPEVKGTEPATAAAPEPLPEVLQPAGNAPAVEYNGEKRKSTPEKVVQQVKNTIVSAKELPATTAAVRTGRPHPEEALPQNKKEEEMTSSLPVGAAVPEPVKEKKNLAQKLNRFFDKLKPKKEEEDPVTERSSPKAQDEAGERQSRRRGEEGGAADKPDLTQFIDISSNAPADNFMAGIHGLELTVRNRSSETVKNGAVEVRYYNDNKELIDKRTVSFASIPPNKKITLKAPDHRLADHADYKLITVN